MIPELTPELDAWLCEALAAARARGGRGVELVNALSGACLDALPQFAMLLDDVVREERDAQARLVGPAPVDLRDAAWWHRGDVPAAPAVDEVAPVAVESLAPVRVRPKYEGVVCRDCGGPFRACGCGSHRGALDLMAR